MLDMTMQGGLVQHKCMMCYQLLSEHLVLVLVVNVDV